MFTLISYNLKTTNEVIQFHNIHLSCEADFKLRDLSTDKRVSNVSTIKFKSLYEARKKQQELRNSTKVN